MQKVASIMRYKGNRDEAFVWLSKLPKVPGAYEVKVIFENLKNKNWLLWTEEGGVRIVK